MMEGIQTEKSVEIDGWLSLPEATLDLAKALESLAPYGPATKN